MIFADRYAAWLLRFASSVQETAPSFQSASLSELDMQARWFSGEFGRSFRAVSGDEVEIVQFGEWNREAGPDFRGAAISINGSRPIAGCIELDPDVRDWERHGHAVNPTYENVVLHVFWKTGRSTLFTQTLSGRAIPQVKLEICSIENGDCTVPCAKCGPCSRALSALNASRVADLFTAAAHYRMRRKAQRIRQTAEIHGEVGALYPFLAEALGYKFNKLPFLLLAQRLPVSQLRKRQTSNLGLESALFGVSGFLDMTDLREFPSETREYLRQLWDDWWPQRAEFGNLILNSSLWKCGGMRPLNHPHRRIGALAEIVRHWSKAREVLKTGGPLEIRQFFAALRHQYWDFHYTLTSKMAAKRMSLIGPDRVNAILMNIVLPMVLRENPDRFEKLTDLIAPDFNGKIRAAALRLFSDEAKRVPILKSALLQQGLLQIYDDFCCWDLSDCRECRFPEQISQW